MSSFGLSGLLIIYGFFFAFIGLGVVFLIMGLSNLNKFKQSRSEGTSAEQIHTSASFSGSDKILEGDRRAWFLAKTFIKLGIIFAGIGLLGIIVFTTARMM